MLLVLVLARRAVGVRARYGVVPSYVNSGFVQRAARERARPRREGRSRGTSTNCLWRVLNAPSYQATHLETPPLHRACSSRCVLLSLWAACRD